MSMFFVLLLVPMMLQHFTIREYRIDRKKKNRLALKFFFVMLTALVMFRHESIGNDTRNYIYYFNKFSGINWNEIGNQAVETGYVCLNKIICLVFDEPQFFLAVAAVATSVMIYPTYKRLCLDPSLTIVLFCTMSTFVLMFSGIRQMLAIGVGFIAYGCVRRKKPLSFLLCVGLAMTLHFSAFMLLFMYPLYHVKITKKWLYAVVPVLAVIFFFNEQLFTVLSVVIARYTKYEGGISATGAYTMLILFILFAFFSFLIPEEESLDKETIGLRNFLLMSIALQMFAPLHVLAMRMNYYYIIFIPLLIPKIIAHSSRRWAQVAEIARNVMVVFFMLYFFYNAYVGGNNLHVFPYRFFWEIAE